MKLSRLNNLRILLRFLTSFLTTLSFVYGAVLIGDLFEMDILPIAGEVTFYMFLAVFPPMVLCWIAYKKVENKLLEADYFTHDLAARIRSKKWYQF